MAGRRAVYGVGGANLLFLPIAAKLKFLVKRRIRRLEMITEGMIGIATAASRQRLVRDRLERLGRSPLMSDSGKSFMPRSRNQAGGFQVCVSAFILGLALPKAVIQLPSASILMTCEWMSHTRLPER